MFEHLSYLRAGTVSTREHALGSSAVTSVAQPIEPALQHGGCDVENRIY